MANGQADGFGQAVLRGRPNDHAIHHGLEVMHLTLRDIGEGFEIVDLAIHADPDKTRLADLGHRVLVPSPPPPHQRRQYHQLGAFGQRHQAGLYLFGRLLLDRFAAAMTERVSQAGHEQPQIVVDLRHGRHGAAGIGVTGPLVDADRRLQALDQVDIRTFHLVQELPRVDRQAFQVLPLAFGVQRVERQAALARTAGTGNHHQLIPRDIDVHVLQVVHARAADPDRFLGIDGRNQGRYGHGPRQSGDRPATKPVTLTNRARVSKPARLAAGGWRWLV